MLSGYVGILLIVLIGVLLVMSHWAITGQSGGARYSWRRDYRAALRHKDAEIRRMRAEIVWLEAELAKYKPLAESATAPPELVRKARGQWE
jgi:hypothetical protein